MEISTFYFPPYSVRLLKKIVLVMKLTTLMLFFFCMHLNAAVFSQQISLSEKQVNLETLFSKIEQQTKYNFFYTGEVLKNLPKVSVDIQNASIQEVLDRCLKNLPVTYSIVANVVVIKTKEADIKPNVAAQRILLGKVTDEKGKPLSGVTIKVKGSLQLTITSATGQFSIVVDDYEKAVLQCSFIGYTTLEVKADTLKIPFTIKMTEDIAGLDEVTVVAYGSNTKRLSTGDQTTVSAKDIAKYPTTNVLDVLQGSVTGLVVDKNTGNPDGTYKVQLRGINGITGGAPLYVVDGIPYQGGSYNSQNTTLGDNTANGVYGQGGNALDFINPLDIESITVLKDASATAIYGTRAADGVIIITTKKGKAGAPKIDASYYNGYTSVNHFPDMLNLQQYLEMREEAKRNDNSPIGPTDYDINGVWDTTRNTNWAKKLLGGEGHVNNAQLAISGGTTNTQYRISTGYSDQTNLTDLGGSNQNANLSFSINTKTDDNKFSVQLNGGYFYNVNTTTPADLTASLTLAPDAPALLNPDGSLNFQNNTFNNPLVAKNLMNNTTGTNLTSSTVISYRPVAGLEFKATLGYNRQQVNEFLGSPTTATAPFSQGQAYSTFTNDINSYWSIEPQINYNKDISKGKLSIVVGSSLQKSVAESTQLEETGYSSDLLLQSISAGTTLTNIESYSYSPYKLSGLFGRLNYNWDNKYLLDVSGRDDGSSHFGANHQFHLFSAVGAGWIFSEENLVKDNLSFLSYGKLRASYGVTGRDNISAYQYLDTYGPSPLSYEGVAGLLPTVLPNPNLTWESTAKAELSMELQFLKGRIAFETNFYRDRTTNVLANSNLTQVTGFTSILENLPAVIQNEGFDISVTGYSFRKTDFTWSTTVLFTRDRNKLLSYPGLAQSAYADQFIIGQPVDIQHVYSFAGVNPQTGVYQFNSKSGAVVSALSLIPGTDNFKTVDIDPSFYGSVQNSFRYKQFTLDFLFRFVKQIGKNAFGQQGSIPPGLSPNLNYTTLVLDRWQKPGDITDVQRYGTNFSLFFAQNDAIQSDHAYGDASYIRFQNLSLAYAFTGPILKKMHMQNLQVFIQGENLLTISRYGAIDPENQSPYSLPPLRTVTTGLRLSL